MKITKISLFTVALLIASQALGMTGLTRTLRTLRPVASRTTRSFTNYSGSKIGQVTREQADQNTQKAREHIKQIKAQASKDWSRNPLPTEHTQAMKNKATLDGFKIADRRLKLLGLEYVIKDAVESLDRAVALAPLEVKAAKANSIEYTRKQLDRATEGIQIMLNDPNTCDSELLRIFDETVKHEKRWMDMLIWQIKNGTQSVAPQQEKATVAQEATMNEKKPRRGIFKYLCGATIAAAIGYKTLGSKE